MCYALEWCLQLVCSLGHQIAPIASTKALVQNDTSKIKLSPGCCLVPANRFLNRSMITFRANLYQGDDAPDGIDILPSCSMVGLSPILCRNRLLFSPSEVPAALPGRLLIPSSDARAQHVLQVML